MRSVGDYDRSGMSTNSTGQGIVVSHLKRILMLLPVILIGAALYLYFVIYVPPVEPRPFDQALWQRSSEEANRGVDNPRKGMVEDLLRQHIKTGLTEGEVRQLLGDPDHQYSEGLAYHYYIGALSRGWGDYDYLILEFGSDGRVGNVRVQRAK
jgi:hypothetical protein